MAVFFYIYSIYVFDDNLGTAGSLTGATLSCHVER